MIYSALAIAAVLASPAAAKTCMNMTVPVYISSRNAVFDVAVPQTNLDVTTFIQNLTQQGRNFTQTALVGYNTVSGSYNISTQFCQPSNYTASHPTVQVLTHGIGFDKVYWDLPYDDFNYSYVDTATDGYKYCTLSYDRLGIGNSSHGEPLNEIQSFLEIQALAELTRMLRNGTFPGVHHAFEKIVHVGHSFGSVQTYAMVNLYPTISDGIVLTGFTMNGSFVGYFAAGGNFVLANRNQPFRFGNIDYASAESVLNMYGLTDYVAGLVIATPVPYANGYMTNADIDSQQYLFFLPGFFDPGLLLFGENNKQPVTRGELLTLGSVAPANNYAGPVMVFTGSNDLPFCGGDCLTTGDPFIPSIPSTVSKSFPKVAPSNYTTYIQPHTGHGLTFHYNATAGYKVIQDFLASKNLQTTI